MKKEELIQHLEAIYIDYYDGLMNSTQLKITLLRLQRIFNSTNASEWSEMILDAQWKHAIEEDYEKKRRQIAEDTLDDEIAEILENHEEVIWVSRLKVCKSNVGYYIGRMARVTYSESEVPWNRKSGYFENEIEAFSALKKIKEVN
ncbi:hypothetical protein [Paenibacillus sp. NRS-1760]|uniref:hypothetical protein n=1 Tax=Paenibacillus sp. NRS-1760 TaxID=3233902 RepID=UPI003D2D6CC2